MANFYLGILPSRVFSLFKVEDWILRAFHIITHLRRGRKVVTQEGNQRNDHFAVPGQIDIFMICLFFLTWVELFVLVTSTWKCEWGQEKPIVFCPRISPSPHLLSYFSLISHRFGGFLLVYLPAATSGLLSLGLRARFVCLFSSVLFQQQHQSIKIVSVCCFMCKQRQTRAPSSWSTPFHPFHLNWPPRGERCQLVCLVLLATSSVEETLPAFIIFHLSVHVREHPKQQQPSTGQI